MKGRKKQPIDLLIAKGKSHLTLAEIEERRKSEIKAPPYDGEAPDYLTASQKRKFSEIARQLTDLNIFAKLDEDGLARFVIAQEQYIFYGKQIRKAQAEGVREKELDIFLLKELVAMEDRYFKQCRTMASDLGLSITARCKLVIPQVEKPTENKFMKFTKPKEETG